MEAADIFSSSIAHFTARKMSQTCIAAIFLSADDEEWARGNQRADHGEIHEVSVVVVNAVALAGSDPMSGLRTKCKGRAHWRSRRDALVHCGRVPGHCAAARDAGQSDACLVHFRPRFQ